MGEFESAFAGVWIIVPTPFDADEAVDEPSVAQMIRFMERLGVSGVTVAGVLGEAVKLTENERDVLVRAAVAATDGRLPVCVGSSGGSPHIVTERLVRAKALGAACSLLSPTSAPGLSDSDVLELFSRAGAVGLPIIVQDHPESSGVSMSTSLLLQMICEIGSVAGIKEEVRNTGPKISALLRGMESDVAGMREVPILAGLGAVNGVNDILRGAHGFMTGVAVPEVLLAIMNHRDDPNALAELERQYLPLLQLEDRLGLAARKWVYAQRGLIADPRLRSPGGAADALTCDEMAAKLGEVLGPQDLRQPLQIPVQIV